MPFTFSHPAAVLPLTYLPKRWYSLTGLVIGSTTPDFEYFIRMRGSSFYSHTWSGAFWFDLPLAIILAFAFHEVVRNHLIDNLPANIKARVWEFKNFDWTLYFGSNFVIIMLNCLVGIASHILWDGLTHEGGLFVQHSEGLRKSIEIAGYTLPVYYLLQHISTVTGGIAILYAFLQWPKSKVIDQPPIFRFWLFISLIAIVIIVTRFAMGKGNYDLGDRICVIIAGFLIGLVVVSFLQNLNQRNIGVSERT
jgi:hypothetical protein